MTFKWPTIRKESTYSIVASHDLRGVTSHPDAAQGLHEHEWKVTLIWESEYNPFIGFIRDEAAVDSGWGKRLAELNGQNLSKLMKLHATAENFACFLLFFWLPRVSDEELSFELAGVRVTKRNHSSQIMRNEAQKRGWQGFGGEVV